MALAARQSQLEHWKTKAERASERLAAALDADATCLTTIAPDPATPPSAGSSSSRSLPPWHSDAARTTSADVGDIVSKWRSVSLQQQREKQELEGQLVATRNALGAMRAQALMLERQMETAEDELESERVSAASRETSVRAQLEVSKEQARESKELLRWRDAAVSAAESAAGEMSVELVGARERIRTLEDLLRATETELRAAMGQITAVQANAEALDARLRAAELAAAELAAASDAAERLLVALRAVAPHTAVTGTVAGSSTVARLEKAFLLVEAVSADAEARAAGLAQLGQQCTVLEAEVEARNGKVAELRARLSSELEHSQGLESHVTQVCPPLLLVLCLYAGALTHPVDTQEAGKLTHYPECRLLCSRRQSASARGRSCTTRCANHRRQPQRSRQHAPRLQPLALSASGSPTPSLHASAMCTTPTLTSSARVPPPLTLLPASLLAMVSCPPSATRCVNSRSPSRSMPAAPRPPSVQQRRRRATSRPSWRREPAQRRRQTARAAMHGHWRRGWMRQRRGLRSCRRRSTSATRRYVTPPSCLRAASGKLSVPLRQVDIALCGIASLAAANWINSGSKRAAGSAGARAQQHAQGMGGDAAEQRRTDRCPHGEVQEIRRGHC
jgi:hypothetical protein